MQSFCTKEQQFPEIGLEWVLSEKGNVGMSTWEEKGNEKTPIPLLPKPIALQKHHKVYLADDDDQWSCIAITNSIFRFNGNFISDISFLPPSNVGVKGNLHEMHQHNLWPIATDGQNLVIVNCEYKNNCDIEMTSFCLTGADAGQSGPMSTHWGSGEVRGRSPHLLPATLD